MDDFDWGNDDSVFIQVPDHVLDTKPNPDSDDCDLNSSSSPLFLSEAEEIADPDTDAPSANSNHLVKPKVHKKKKESSMKMKEFESKRGRPKERHRLSSSQPIARTTPDNFSVNSPVLKMKPAEVGFGNFSRGIDIPSLTTSPGNFSPPYDQSPFRVQSNDIDWSNDTNIFNAIPDVIDANTVIPDYNLRRSSSSPSFNRSHSPVTKRKPGKTKTSKDKTKAGAKIKLPKKLGMSKEVDGNKSKGFPRSSSFSLSQPVNASVSHDMTPPNPSRVSLTQEVNPAPDQTPMLNYSCIDTPILKVMNSIFVYTNFSFFYCQIVNGKVVIDSNAKAKGIS